MRASAPHLVKTTTRLRRRSPRAELPDQVERGRAHGMEADSFGETLCAVRASPSRFVFRSAA